MAKSQAKRDRRSIEKAAAVKARRMLAFGFQKSNADLFVALGEHFGTPWDGTKPHGYDMAIKLAGALVVPKARKAAPADKRASDEFLSTYQWRRLRMEVLIEQGRRCQCCGATPDNGVVMHVDHIKPRRLFPELALVKSNLQVLCEVCNHGKGNWDQTDWKQEAVEPAKVLPMWSRRVG